MATSCKVGVVQTGTGTGNIAVSGLGFQPKVVIFWGTALTAPTTGSDNANFGFGWATGATQRGCVFLNGRDNVGTTNSKGQHRNDACFGLRLTDSSANDGLLDLVSLDADGFTVAPDDAFAADYDVNYLALGGSSITNVIAGNSTAPTTSGTFDVTGLGFQPTKLLLLHYFRTTTSFNTTDGGGFGLGVYDGSSSRCIAFFSLDGTAVEQSGAIIRNDSVMNAINDASNTNRYTFDSFLADGFRLNKQDGTSGHTFSYLAFAGIDLKVTDPSNQAATGNFSISGVGFKPSGLLVAGLRGAGAFQTSQQGDVQVCIGGASGPSERAACMVSFDDAADPTDTATTLSTSHCYTQHGITTHALDHAWDFVSFDTDGYTLNQTNATGATHVGVGIAFGPAAAAGGGGSTIIMRRRRGG